jgi:topoisomerase IA-like protein
VVRGFSLFVVEDGEFRVRRYIDWIGLYAQLGLGVNWRVPIDTVPEGQAFQDVAALEAAAEAVAERPARAPTARKATAKKARAKQAPSKKTATKRAGAKKAGAKRAAKR